MKKSLVIGAAIVAIVMVTPKFLAAPINQQVGNIVTKINDAPGYKASITEQHSGWFTSFAKINVAFDVNTSSASSQDGSDIYEDLNGELTLHIQHGPILLANGISLGLAAWSIETDKTLLRDTLSYPESQSIYTIKGNTGFSGDSHYKDEIAAFSTTENTENTFSGWAGKGLMSNSGSYYSGVTQAVKIANENASGSIENIALNIELDGNWLTALDNPIYNSTGNFSIDSFSLTPAAAPFGANPSKPSPITIDGLAINFKTQKNTDETLIDTLINYGFKKIESPTLSASDFIFNMELKNLEKEFLKAYQNTVSDPEGYEAGLQKMLENNLLAQLQTSPEVNIKELSIHIDGNKFSGNLFTKVENIDTLPAQLNDTRFWIQHTTASTNIKLDKAFALTLGESILLPQLANNPGTQSLPVSQHKEIVASQVNGMLSGLIVQGLLVEKDESYEADLRLEKGQATINGQATPLPF